MRIEANANTIKQHIYIYATVFSKVFKHKKSKTSLSCFGFSIFKTQKLFFSFKNQYEKQSVPNRFLLFFVFKNQKQFLKSIVKQAPCFWSAQTPLCWNPSGSYERILLEEYFSFFLHMSNSHWILKRKKRKIY